MSFVKWKHLRSIVRTNRTPDDHDLYRFRPHFLGLGIALAVILVAIVIAIPAAYSYFTRDNLKLADARVSQYQPGSPVYVSGTLKNVPDGYTKYWIIFRSDDGRHFADNVKPWGYDIDGKIEELTPVIIVGDYTEAVLVVTTDEGSKRMAAARKSKSFGGYTNILLFGTKLPEGVREVHIERTTEVRAA